MHLQRALKYTFCKMCGERNSYHSFTWPPRGIPLHNRIETELFVEYLKYVKRLHIL